MVRDGLDHGNRTLVVFFVAETHTMPDTPGGKVTARVIRISQMDSPAFQIGNRTSKSEESSHLPAFTHINAEVWESAQRG